MQNQVTDYNEIFNKLDIIFDNFDFEEESFSLEKSTETEIKGLFNSLHSGDIAEYINSSSKEVREVIIDSFSSSFNPNFVTQLNEEVTKEIIKRGDQKLLKKLFSKLDVNEVVGVLEDVSDTLQSKVLESFPKKLDETVSNVLAYPEDSVGRIMDVNFISVSLDWNVGQVIDYLRADKKLSDDFYAVFVEEENGKPVGVIPLSRIMRSNRDIEVSKIMEDIGKKFDANTDQEEAAYNFQKYSLVSAPVVSKDEKLIGVVDIDHIANVIGEETEEDIMRLAGVSSSDISTSFTKTALHRMPWLLINLLTAISASAIIEIFSDTIHKMVVLAVLMPIVASMAGNAGTQTLAVSVRAIATKELSFSNAFKIMYKELLSGFLNGLFFAILVFVITYFVYGNLMMSAVFAFSMVVCLLVAGFFGVATPILLVRMGVDPAIASSVFLTTITDMSAFFIFLGLAFLIL